MFQYFDVSYLRFWSIQGNVSVLLAILITSVTTSQRVVMEMAVREVVVTGEYRRHCACICVDIL